MILLIDKFIKCYQTADFLNRLIVAWQFCKQALLLGKSLRDYYIITRMFEFLTENNLVSDNQSGFRSGDSCTYQFLSITHEICQSFDDNPEVKAIFLDISKAFDKVLHTN